MRTWLRWGLVLFGVLAVLSGAAAMIVLGPDSRFTKGPHAIETDDIAVVTAPRAIRWADVQVDVLAEVPVRKPVFIGIANAVDVQDYVGKTQRLEVTSLRRPFDLTTRQVEGMPNLPGAPTALDWWIESSAGLGGASISTQLPDETVSVAILSVGSSNLSGLEVTVAYGVKGGFAKAAALLLMGLALIWLGILARRGRWYVDDDEYGEESLEHEIVYVYVDEDGVEREISAEEAADLEVVEEVEFVSRTLDSEKQSELSADQEAALPTIPQKVVPGVPTAAEIAAAWEVDGGVAEARGDVADTPDTAQSERIVYVYVDEDGVEHEVNEEELDEFEVVEGEEDPR